MIKIIIKHKGVTQEAREDNWQEVMDTMVAQMGAWDSATSSVSRVETMDVPANKPVSDFGAPIVDKEAEQRIKKLHAEMAAGGLKHDESSQFYATGTRMAQVGYDTQAERFSDHQAKETLDKVASKLISRINAEGRRSLEITAGEFADGLAMNGKLTFNGLAVREQALRGLLTRQDSKAMTYVLSLRDNIRCKPEDIAEERAMLLEVVKRECQRASMRNTKLKLRTRQALKDIFAIMSPGYGEADAPETIPSFVKKLGENAKGTYAYDPASTDWEIRAYVWTPTKVAEQAVGEPFEGYGTIQGRDNGTGKYKGGGGASLLACLNAGVIVVEIPGMSGVHRAGILRAVGAIQEAAVKGIETMCKVWGIARQQIIEPPRTEQGKLIPLEEAIPGLYRAMLTARKGELVGVLPGRTVERANKLASMYFDQRRNPKDITRADLANGYTRLIKDEPFPVRIRAEAAIGGWLASKETPAYVEA